MVLRFFVCIDQSISNAHLRIRILLNKDGNLFSGKIPESIGGLFDLKVLNLCELS